MEYTEEEKKAIEECEELIKEEYYGDMYFYERRSIQIILNLLQNQQKEINELNNENKRIKYFSNNLFIDDYIPKEAIREKIDDLQRYKGLVMYEKYNYDAIIRHLKELLGE